LAKGSGRGDDIRLERALEHPLRLAIVGALRDGDASPAELATRLGEPVGVVAYHCRQLGEIGALEQTRTLRREGRTEHFFRAAPGVLRGP
jgi:DNA-binding transcriptional ArsR family regulator